MGRHTHEKRASHGGGGHSDHGSHKKAASAEGPVGRVVGHGGQNILFVQLEASHGLQVGSHGTDSWFGGKGVIESFGGDPTKAIFHITKGTDGSGASAASPRVIHFDAPVAATDDSVASDETGD